MFVVLFTRKGPTGGWDIVGYAGGITLREASIFATLDEATPVRDHERENGQNAAIHTYACAVDAEARRVWIATYPNYCKVCDGWGVTGSEDDPQVCPHCETRCARCRDALMEDACPSCGWQADSPQGLQAAECECWFVVGQPNTAEWNLPF